MSNDVYSLKIGDRIQELMHTLGFKKTTVFAKEIGMSVTTFKRILDSERDATGYYSAIANGLGISVERMMQYDVKPMIQEFEIVIVSNCRKAVEIAKELCEMSIGITEHVDAINYLGRAYSKIGDFGECATLWRSTLDMLIEHKPHDSKRIERAIKNTIWAYGKTKEIDKRIEIIEKAKEHFDNEPALVAQYLYVKGTNEKMLMRYEIARNSLESALSTYRELEDRRYIGRCLAVIGETYFLEKNFKKAFDSLEISRERAFKDEFQFVQYFTEIYVKVCSQLGKFDSALNLMKQVMEIFGESKFHDSTVNAKMLYYYKVIKQNIEDKNFLSLFASSLI